MNLETVPKKVQYLIIDSDLINGESINNFNLNIGFDSNVFLENRKNIIGLQVVEFYLTQIGSAEAASSNVAKYIDIVCMDVPQAAQLLDERHGQVLTRVAIERKSGTSVTAVNDKQWKSFPRKTNYFNPISIDKLNFQLYESQGDGDYLLMKPDVSFYMIIEITTIDVKAAKKDPNEKLLKGIEQLYKSVQELKKIAETVPIRPILDEPKKNKIPSVYLFAILAAIGYGVYYYFFFRRPSLAGISSNPQVQLFRQ
jgi:hypothetical protein